MATAKTHNFRIHDELFDPVKKLAQKLETTPADLVRQGLVLMLEKYSINSNK